MSAIAVIGMGRSGTSYVTQALAQCGCHVGEVNRLYEHTGVREINDRLLAASCGAALESLPYGEIRECAVPEAARAEAREIVAALCAGQLAAGSPHWLIKDPRITLLQDLWWEHIDIFVGMVRRPSEVVDSYIDAGFINCADDRRAMSDYWFHFNSILLDLVEFQKWPTYLLHFDETIDDQLDRLTGLLGLAGDDRPRFEPALKHFNHSEAAQAPDERLDWLYRRLLRHQMDVCR